MGYKEKYCAFGLGYKDCKGTIIEESETYYIVKAESYGIYKLALEKNELIKVFDTSEERDNWIESKHYQYDER